MVPRPMEEQAAASIGSPYPTEGEDPIPNVVNEDNRGASMAAKSQQAPVAAEACNAEASQVLIQNSIETTLNEPSQQQQQQQHRVDIQPVQKLPKRRAEMDPEDAVIKKPKPSAWQSKLSAKKTRPREATERENSHSSPIKRAREIDFVSLKSPMKVNPA